MHIRVIHRHGMDTEDAKLEEINKTTKDFKLSFRIPKWLLEKRSIHPSTLI